MPTSAARTALVCTVMTVLPGGCGTENCPEIHVAAGTNMATAADCGIAIYFSDRLYWGDCLTIHPSRVGARLDAYVQDDPPAEALRANGFDPNDVFLLNPIETTDYRGSPSESSFCDEEWMVAVSDGYGEPGFRKRLLRPHR